MLLKKKILFQVVIVICFMCLLTTTVFAASKSEELKQQQQIFILVCSILPDGIYKTNLEELNTILKNRWVIEKITPIYGTYREGDSTIISSIITLRRE